MFEKNVPLNDFVTLQRGFDLPKNDRLEGNVPVVASTGIGGYHNEAKVKAPGVVIGRSGSIGGGQYIRDDFWPLNTSLWVKDFKGHDPRYVYYLFRSIDFKQFNVGTGVPTLNRNHLSSIFVSDIGISREKQIAKIIGDLDDRIELNRQINQTLEHIAQTIFKTWFVDFEPTRAKVIVKQKGGDEEIQSLAAQAILCGAITLADLDALSNESSLQSALSNLIHSKLPDQNSGKQSHNLLTEQLIAIAALFPNELVDSELGDIPKGWSVGRLGHIAKAKGGYAFKGTSFIEKGSPVVKIKNITGDGRVDLNDCQCISVEHAHEVNRFKLENGDLLMAMTGATVGKIGFIVTDGRAAYLNQRVAKFESERFKNNISAFLYCCFQRDSIFESIVGTAQGSAQANISSSGIESIQLILPTDDLINFFCKKTDSLFKKWRSNIDENRYIENLRNTLLPKLLSGELSVSTEQLDELQNDRVSA